MSYAIETTLNGRSMRYEAPTALDVVRLMGMGKSPERVPLSNEDAHHLAIVYDFARRYIQLKKNRSPRTVDEFTEREVCEVEALLDRPIP